MRRKNADRRERIMDRLAQFVDHLNEDFTGLLRIEVPVLRGIMGVQTVTISERDTRTE